MNDLIIAKEIKMTSLELADITGKQHTHIMRDIRNEIDGLGEEIGQSIFGLTSYLDQWNREQPCYEFGRDGAMQLALKYDAITRRKVILKLEELEKAQRPTGQNLLALAVIEAQKVLEQKDLVIQEQQQQIEQDKPKVTYYDFVLQCKDLLSMTTVSKDYGKSAYWMNEKLHELGIQYCRGGIWFLYQKYAGFGYTQTQTHIHSGNDGEVHGKPHTYWTQAGRLFIYEQLKKYGIVPLIEKPAQLSFAEIY